MRLLLDTHIAVWSIVDDARLSARARELIQDPANSVFVSAASVWEITIKHALRRGGANDMPIGGTVALEYFQGSGYNFLAVTERHAAAVETLPRLHDDPFDRILLAQAVIEPLRLLTGDRRVLGYGDVALAI